MTAHGHLTHQGCSPGTVSARRPHVAAGKTGSFECHSWWFRSSTPALQARRRGQQSQRGSRVGGAGQREPSLQRPTVAQSPLRKTKGEAGLAAAQLHEGREAGQRRGQAARRLLVPSFSLSPSRLPGAEGDPGPGEATLVPSNTPAHRWPGKGGPGPLPPTFVNPRLLTCPWTKARFSGLSLTTAAREATRVDQETETMGRRPKLGAEDDSCQFHRHRQGISSELNPLSRESGAGTPSADHTGRLGQNCSPPPRERHASAAHLGTSARSLTPTAV